MNLPFTYAADVDALRVFLRPLLRGLVDVYSLGMSTGIPEQELREFVAETKPRELRPNDLHRLDRFLRQHLSYVDPLRGRQLSSMFRQAIEPRRNDEPADYQQYQERHIRLAFAQKLGEFFLEQNLVEVVEETHPAGSPEYFGGHRQMTLYFNRLPTFDQPRAADEALTTDLAG